MGLQWFGDRPAPRPNPWRALRERLAAFMDDLDNATDVFPRDADIDHAVHMAWLHQLRTGERP